MTIGALVGTTCEAQGLCDAICLRLVGLNSNAVTQLHRIQSAANYAAIDLAAEILEPPIRFKKSNFLAELPRI